MALDILHLVLYRKTEGNAHFLRSCTLQSSNCFHTAENSATNEIIDLFSMFIDLKIYDFTSEIPMPFKIGDNVEL